MKRFCDLKKGDIIFELKDFKEDGTYANEVHLLGDPVWVENEDEKYLYLLYDSVHGYSIPPTGYVINEDEVNNTYTYDLVINKEELYDRYIQRYEKWKKERTLEIEELQTRIDKIKKYIEKHDDLFYKRKKLNIL